MGIVGSDSLRCYSFSQPVIINNGDSAVIKFTHLKSNSSFSLVRYVNDSPVKVNVDKAIQILDANSVSINTGLLNLDEGEYALNSNNDICSDVRISISIK